MRALMIIDMQRWMFRYPERADQISGLTRNIAALARAFSATRQPIYDVRTEHKADRSTWSRLMREYDQACLIEGTLEAAPVEGFDPPQATRIVKHANSAFLGTDLESGVKRAGIRELVLAGVFIDGCVGLTAADAAQRGLAVTLVADAIGHTKAERRDTIFEWLVSDYEMKARPTTDILAELNPVGPARG